jgi:hypothetical protein
MNQKIIILEVFDKDGSLIFRKEPAAPQDVISAIGLFDKTGNRFSLEIGEVEIPHPSAARS